jgi:anaerobic ribonucleoside-triphosphate reductase
MSPTKVTTKDFIVVKRDGSKVPFDKKRIRKAIAKAGEATGEFGQAEAGKIAERASHFILKSQAGKKETSVESIQDVVEFALASSGHFKTSRAYIVYREKRAQARAMKNVAVEVEQTIGEYLNRKDWRVNANANQGYSLGGLILNAAGKLIANYWLNCIYSKDIRDAHIEGDVHIHDLDMFTGYCAGWSLRQLLEQGFNGVSGKVESAPPKHLEPALGQMVNFLGTLQNEWAGAQAFSSFDTYLAPFVKIDKLDYATVRQAIQQFVFNLNVPSRWGTQTPFTNITLDWNVPEDLAKMRPVIGGVTQKFTYADCQTEMDLINRAFIDVMTAGDSKGRVFTFPIPTYNITKDFNWDHPNAQALFEMTAKFGIPYFQNFVNSTLKPSDVRSMCCRLQLDLRQLRARGGGLFGSAEMTGSIGVVTLNLARLGYLARNKQEFFDRLDHLMVIAKQSLELKRKVVSENIERGLLPYTKRYLPSLHNHFSTIGINGGNECCLNFVDQDIASKEGKAFMQEVLAYMRKRLSDFQEETGHFYNLEATPAEGTTYRFAKEDQKRFPGIIQAGTVEAPYYTNSTHLPVDYTDDALMALSHQDALQTAYTGGTVLHLFLGERVQDWRACRALVKKVAGKFHMPYYTITPTFSICPEHGYIRGEVRRCPTCEATCEVWSRIVGYYRPVDQWNTGKKQEYAERIEYVADEKAKGRSLKVGELAKTEAVRAPALSI